MQARLKVVAFTAALWSLGQGVGDRGQGAGGRGAAIRREVLRPLSLPETYESQIRPSFLVLYKLTSAHGFS